MQYLFFFLASVLIWSLGFKLLSGKSPYLQNGLVIILVPVAVLVTREIRYFIVDNIGMFRLEGRGTIWDFYIPSLFMFIQFGCLFAYRYFKESQERLKIESVLRQSALKSELAAIRAQLNPHFLYNVFNSINASIPEENEHTRNLIAQLSDLFRYQLKASKEEFVPLREELDFIEKYLALEKERFEERLTVQITVEEGLEDLMIPPMILQPLVENSIKHGLSGQINGGLLSLSAKRNGDKVHFQVSDTGIGIDLGSDLFNKGFGLSNTQLRLEKIYHTQMTFSRNKPKGTVVEFAI